MTVTCRYAEAEVEVEGGNQAQAPEIAAEGHGRANGSDSGLRAPAGPPQPRSQFSPSQSPPVCRHRLRFLVERCGGNGRQDARGEGFGHREGKGADAVFLLFFVVDGLVPKELLAIL